MQIFIDLDSRKLIRGVANNQPIISLDFKRGDDATLEVVYVRSSLQRELAVGTAITFGVKNDGEFDGVPLVFEDSFTKSGAGATTVYTGHPSFNTVPLNALLNLDSDTANDKKMVTLMGEITWLDGVSGAITSSETFVVRVFNDVIRGDEAAPASGPNPIGDTVPVNAVAAAAAYGSITVTGAPVENDSVSIGGDSPATFTWKDSPSGIYQIITNSPSFPTTEAEHLASAINAADMGVAAVASVGVVYITAPDGSAGNAIDLNYGGPFSASGSYLSGGADEVIATVSPPHFRVASGFLYVQESGIWKKVALSAL